MKTVLQIAGTCFSGSSMLNLLCGTQPGVYAIGEACHAYVPEKPLPLKQDIHCHLCATTLDRCAFYRDIRLTHFYQDCMEKSGCDVLVDSSKNVHLLKAIVPGYSLVVAFLSKMPHEFAESYARRHRVGARECFRYYCDRYRDLLAAYLAPDFTATFGIVPTIETVRYRDVALRPHEAVRQLCACANTPFDPAALKNWNLPHSHVIGGNGMVASQIVEHRKRHLQWHPKYKGKEGIIFLDEFWRKDEQFIQDCRDAYAMFRAELQEILPFLGQPPLEEILQDLGRGPQGFAVSAPSLQSEGCPSC